MELLVVSILFFLQGLSAQDISLDDNETGERLHDNIVLFNGRIFQSPYFNRNNHPFFENNTWINGSITIENETFTSIPLKYDIIEDQIIMNISVHSTGLAIQPSVTRINGFTFDKRSFIHLSHEEYPECHEGFYEVLCSGTYSLYLRHQKHYRKSDASSDIWPVSHLNYLVFNKQIFQIRKRSELKQLFFDNAEVLDFIQNQHHSPRINRSDLLIQLCNYLNTCYTQ